MIVHVRFSKGSGDPSAGEEFSRVVDVPVGATVGEVLAYVNLSGVEEVKVAGARVGPDRPLRDGDVVELGRPL